ncbi:Nucleoside-diphosphate-sugar epimerase [Kordiimonas lacus]|uniref:Nucleoside-diphosphate-sugar epimerase n=2 Tax=Kordiimonas lacus TaxID=637679 RepID=A0A1G7BEZ5_9PROT|nr:Nucleoside-diphosphate-sugar epimerase [Kordiimonas lacus]
MKIFMTGASGYVGNHCLQAFLAAGHQVTALTRRPQAFSHPHLVWHQGSLEHPASYEEALSGVDAIVHQAMEYQDGADQGMIDRVAVEAFIRSGKYVAYTGNLYTSHRPGEALAEQPIPDGHHWWNDHENMLLEAGQAAVIRLGFVYGGSGGYLWPGFAPDASGTVLWCGEPNGRWPMVHVDDVASLFLRAIEERATGIFHAVDDTPVTHERLLNAICLLQGGTLTRVSLEAARARLGGFADHLEKDIVATNTAARSLDWQPGHPDFLASAEEAFTAYRQHREKECA